jgi:hypothetical protein
MSFENDKELFARVLKSRPKAASQPRTVPVDDFKGQQFYRHTAIFSEIVLTSPCYIPRGAVVVSVPATRH